MNEPRHAVAVIGGACAGSVVAQILADAGAQVVVFEQNPRPYGKIEDGLPRWHARQRQTEYERIDERLDRPRVVFVPSTRLGKDVGFLEVLQEWGFNAVVLANGAWKDRELSGELAREAVGRGVVYQNALVTWFNHKHEVGYAGPEYQMVDGALVVGGGLASIDCLKIIQLELYASALRERGVAADVLEMEHKGIPRYCAAHGFDDPSVFGIDGALLLYRRRAEDMPLASMPDDADEKTRLKIESVRVKVLENAQRKYLFRARPQTVLQDVVMEEGRVVGGRVVATRVSGRGVTEVEGSEEVLPTGLVVSSIGSIPEPIEGIEMDGSYYAFADWETGRYGPLPHVFASGNVITGQGNIKVSVTHGMKIGKVMTSYLEGAREAASAVEADLAGQPKLTPEALEVLMRRVGARQAEVGYGGDYRGWIEANTPVVAE